MSDGIAFSASISKRPVAFLIEFSDKKPIGDHQPGSFATISIVEKRESGTDRHQNISRVKNPEKYTDIFHKLYLQLANKNVGVIELTEGHKVDHPSKNLPVLVEFFDRKPTGDHQQSSFATISVVDKKNSGTTDQHLKISRVNNPEKFAAIFHKLHLQLPYNENGVIDLTGGNKEDNPGHLPEPTNCISSPSTNLVKEITRKLGGHNDLSKVVAYLAAAEEELLQQLSNSLDGSPFTN